MTPYGRWARLAVSLSMMLLVSVVILLSPTATNAAPPPTGGTVIDNETFTGSSVADPAWRIDGSTCLTGASTAPPAGAAQIPTCDSHRSGPVPPAGITPGYLQFTDTAAHQAGDIVYNRPILATAGLSVVFEQYQYGGNEADGIGFFLADGASTSVPVGGSGGSLGYAPKAGAPGVPGGYVGVGLDVFGNFYDDGEGRGLNCPVGQRSPAGAAVGRIAPNVVTLRGPGNGLNGYCWLAATTDNGGQGQTSTLPGSLRGPAGTTDPQLAKRLVNVQVTPVPSPRIIVQIDFTGTGTSFIPVLDEPAPAGTPTTYKFGFLGSTGGNTDVHLIRNVVVQTINPLNALQLQKQVDRTAPLPPVITPGTRIPYQYVVTNAGVGPLTGLTVADDKVTGITCDSTTLPPAPNPAATTICRGSYVVTTADAAAGQVVNTATATATGSTGSVSSPPSSVTVPLTSALEITKSVQTPPPYSVGQTITYSYQVRNTGGTRLTEIAVSDSRIAAGGVICDVGALDPGATTTCTGPFTITAASLTNGLLTNTATASGVSPIGQSVNSGPDSATIAVAADIAVTKTVTDATPTVGESVTFTVTVTNNGPGIGSGVIVGDQVPPGLTLTAATPSAGTYDPGSGNWTLPDLPVGGSQTLRLTTTVDTAAPITNGATVRSAAQPDPVMSNNSASQQLNPVAPTVDIAIVKRVSQPGIRVGQQASYTVTATNNGPLPATGVVVRDPLPAQLLAFVSSTATQGSYDPATTLWNVGSLAVGGSADLTIVVRGIATGLANNTAALAAVDQTDINQLNDQDTAALQITPPQADLVVTKTVASDPVTVGDVVTYTVTAFNIGPDPAPSVTVDDFGVLPSGLTIISATASQGTIDTTNVRWDVGLLNPGVEPAVLTMNVRVDTPGTKVNSVVISDPTITDPDPSNNTASAPMSSNLPPLNIGIAKTADATGILVGAPITFTVTATNDGPNAATGLTIGDPLPAGVNFVSAASSVGSYDSPTGIWTIGNLASGESATLTLSAVGARAGDWVNAAALARVDQQDTDPSDNSAQAPFRVSESADLAITKTVTPTVAAPGDTVTYTITVTNNGPNTAHDIRAVEPTRSVEDFLTVVPSRGTFRTSSREWVIGTLAPGESATLTIEAVVGPVSGTFVNTATIIQSSLPDPDLTNNSDQAVLTVPGADLAVTKTSNTATVPIGGEVVFTIQATNRGPDTATGVTVNDTIPAGLTLVSATPSVGTFAAGVWTIGILKPGQTETLQLRLIGATPGEKVNTATIASTGPPDPEPGNNTATASVTVQPSPGGSPTPTPTAPAGSLPPTGDDGAPAGFIIGAALILAGVLLFLVTLRQRRQRAIG